MPFCSVIACLDYVPISVCRQDRDSYILTSQYLLLGFSSSNDGPDWSTFITWSLHLTGWLWRHQVVVVGGTQYPFFTHGWQANTFTMRRHYKTCTPGTIREWQFTQEMVVFGLADVDDRHRIGNGT